jgi:hypothetical protein
VKEQHNAAESIAFSFAGSNWSIDITLHKEIESLLAELTALNSDDPAPESDTLH